MLMITTGKQRRTRIDGRYREGKRYTSLLLSYYSRLEHEPTALKLALLKSAARMQLDVDAYSLGKSDLTAIQNSLLVDRISRILIRCGVIGKGSNYYLYQRDLIYGKRNDDQQRRTMRDDTRPRHQLTIEWPKVEGTS